MRLGKYLSSLTKPEVEEIKTNCNFTDDELKVFNGIVKGNTVSKIALDCCMSERTVERKFDKINSKIMSLKERETMKKEVPIADKYMLTVEEAAAYFNIGEARIKEITDGVQDLTVMVGVKRLINRKKMEQYLDGVLVL